MATDENKAFPTITCPHCGKEVAPAKRCPHCGQFLPRPKRKSLNLAKLTPVEIFLAILGAIILAVALVAL